MTVEARSEVCYCCIQHSLKINDGWGQVVVFSVICIVKVPVQDVTITSPCVSSCAVWPCCVLLFSGGEWGVPGGTVRGHQLVCHPRQARHNHAQGHPARPAHPRRACVKHTQLARHNASFPLTKANMIICLFSYRVRVYTDVFCMWTCYFR